MPSSLRIPALNEKEFKFSSAHHPQSRIIKKVVKNAHRNKFLLDRLQH